MYYVKRKVTTNTSSRLDSLIRYKSNDDGRPTAEQAPSKRVLETQGRDVLHGRLPRIVPPNRKPLLLIQHEEHLARVRVVSRPGDRPVRAAVRVQRRYELDNIVEEFFASAERQDIIAVWLVIFSPQC